MTEAPTGVKTLAIRLSDDLHAQIVLVAQLDGLSLADAIRAAIEESITRRRESGELAERAEAVLEQIDRETQARRNALQSLLGSAEPTSQKPARRRPAEETM